jgi:hypothetical protein
MAVGPTHSRETLKHALRLSERLVRARPRARLLDPPDLHRLGRAAKALGGTGANGTADSGLGALLAREIESLRDLASGHPLNSTLERVLAGGTTPATLTVVSLWNHDAEALSVILPVLQSRGCRVIDLSAGRRRPWT